MFQPLVYTALTLLALMAASYYFNRRIDATPIRDRPDGLTAYWVAIGSTYSIAGAAIVLAVWQQHMPDGPGFAFVAFGLIWVTFSASGLPMIVGDIRRSHAMRRTRSEELSLQ